MNIAVEGTEERVCNDIADRQKVGKSKYGTTVEQNPLTLRQWLQHAYEETLDQAIYLRRAIEEIDGPEKSIDEKLKDLNNPASKFVQASQVLQVEDHKGDPFTNPFVDSEGNKR